MLRKKKTRRRYFRTSIALLLAAVLALQGTSPLFVQAKDVMGNTPRTVDFSRPEALRSLEEAGVEEGTPQGARSGRTVSGQGEQGGRDGFEESQGGQPQEGTPAGTDETNASDKTSTDDKENPTDGTGDSTGNGAARMMLAWTVTRPTSIRLALAGLLTRLTPMSTRPVRKLARTA